MSGRAQLSCPSDCSRRNRVWRDLVPPVSALSRPFTRDLSGAHKFEHGPVAQASLLSQLGDGQWTVRRWKRHGPSGWRVAHVRFDPRSWDVVPAESRRVGLVGRDGPRAKAAANGRPRPTRGPADLGRAQPVPLLGLGLLPHSGGPGYAADLLDERRVRERRTSRVLVEVYTDEGPSQDRHQHLDLGGVGRPGGKDLGEVR